MSKKTKPQLPPNPYKRSPIRKLEDLAGRARERKTIRYYLNLTASGDSPHLALIGQRGVGKTSLLNGAECIARELKLLPVRLDMNEQKAESPGRFWHDLYQTLALSMVKAGCWGGEDGTIYAELLKMIHSRQPGDLAKSVMQIPYVLSCHQGPIDSFECPDSLVVSDFNACLAELRDRDFTGIALLIDEADCLGKNVALLQMFRNIFQTVEGCSLLLAGTEAVFPSLSEVFSPIPRQFHRVDVKAFAQESDTMALVLRPIAKTDAPIHPKFEVLMELHALCGGAPDEIQLYCHHMYRSVEDGSSVSMALSPQVFREVLREYRANTPAGIESVLNAIEQLPDKLLFESRWLSRRNVTLEENIQVEVLSRELKRGEVLSVEERAKIAEELTEGYHALFEAGITTINNRIQLAGAPLTAGFWKSYVTVERTKRWHWNDDSFGENLIFPIRSAIGKACGNLPVIDDDGTDDHAQALNALRTGDGVINTDEDIGSIVFAARIGKIEKSTHAVDLSFRIDSPASQKLCQFRLFERPDEAVPREVIDKWLETRRTVLADNHISLTLVDLQRWKLPTFEELHRLARISGSRIPEGEFGPTEFKQAISKFSEGDTQGCMDIFERMLIDREDSHIRNNLAFCQILTGNSAQGLENATRAVQDGDEPLYELNKGIAQYLLGDTAAAKQSLHVALQRLRASDDADFSEAIYAIVLEPTVMEVRSHEGLTVEVAILLNLHRMDSLEYAELERELAGLNPDKASEWLESFGTP